ncbi:MAG: hypothetical protein VX181_16815, partial [Pseudomonadota bacterium]|nr:hypothetical protein [Pseudomonadota bacterium]
MRQLASLLTLALSFFAVPVQALECQRLSYLDTPYTICEVDPAADDLRLFHSDARGLLGHYARINQLLE